MKKYLLVVKTLSVMAIVICLAACTKNSNSSNTSIVGTWRLTNFHEVDIDSTTNPISVNTKDTSFVLILQFDSSNSCSSFNNTQLLNGNFGAYTLYGNDSISYVFGPGPPPIKAKYTIQGTTLTFFNQPHYFYDSMHLYIVTENFIRLK